MFPKSIACCICGTISPVYEIASTSIFGSPDLDTRPPEMQRSTIKYWIQRCPTCGYCSRDLTEAHKITEKILAESTYQYQLNHGNYSKLANSFLCLSMIENAAKKYSSTTWALIHAAWVCDDDDKLLQAKECRVRAAKMLILSEENSQLVSEQPFGSYCILLDLLRRSEQFAEANKLIDKHFFKLEDYVMQKIFNFQLHLIENNDLRCYTIEDAMNFENSTSDDKL
jgi:hypothetical protein